MIKKHKFKSGCKRVMTKDFSLYEKKTLFWKKLKQLPKSAKITIDLFTHYDNSQHLIDENFNKFLKGHLTPENRISGKRINILPNGIKLARGGFSLFAKDLKFNLSKDNLNSYDVSFENESGTRTYLYSIDKVHLEQEQKYKLVQEFDEFYEEILEKLDLDIDRFEDKRKYLALYTLIMSKIRVGNFEYFTHSGHKGLTTLQKKDLLINKENSSITFNFIGKDAVPQNIIVKYPEKYIIYLKDILSKIKKDDFVFSNKSGHPIEAVEFSDILFSYTNKHFYPHIIRSHYADRVCENFIRNNKNKKVTQENIDLKINEIAKNLGHKKFDKKTNSWQINSKVTIESYIYPPLIEQMKEMIKN